MSLLGVPLGGGAAHPGTAFGPGALRAAGIAHRLSGAGCTVTDCGDVFVLPSSAMAAGVKPGVHNGAALRSWICAVSSHAYALAASGTIPLFLGGDHSLSIGTINGVGRHWQRAGRPLFVVWIDAYADCETPSTTRSGNLQGMAAAAVLGEPELDGLFAGGPQLALGPDRFALIGPRWIEPHEATWLQRRGVPVVPMAQIAERGSHAVDALIARMMACGGVVHVSIDVAVLGGAQPRRDVAGLRALLKRLARTQRVVSADLVEFNPTLDEQPQAARRAVDLLTVLLAEPPARPRAGCRAG